MIYGLISSGCVVHASWGLWQLEFIITARGHLGLDRSSLLIAQSFCFHGLISCNLDAGGFVFRQRFSFFIIMLRDSSNIQITS